MGEGCSGDRRDGEDGGAGGADEDPALRCSGPRVGCSRACELPPGGRCPQGGLALALQLGVSVPGLSSYQACRPRAEGAESLLGSCSLSSSSRVRAGLSVFAAAFPGAPDENPVPCAGPAFLGSLER